MKKRFVLFGAALCILFLLCGCNQVASPQDDAANVAVTTPEITEDNVQPTEETAPLPQLPEITVKTMDNNEISPELAEMSLEAYAEFDAKSPADQAASSLTPGMCFGTHDSWNDFEEFLGTTIYNPLENCQLLANNSPVRTQWYGTREGLVESLFIQKEYKFDSLRVTLDLQVYFSFTPGEDEIIYPIHELYDSDYFIISDDTVFYVLDVSDNYFLRAAYFAQDAVIYRISVIGKESEQEEVIDAFDKIREIIIKSPVPTPTPTPEPPPVVTPEPTFDDLPTYTFAPFTGTVSTQVIEEILAEFVEFDAHPEKQDSMQSFSPVGTVQKQFATWDECEEYLGFSIPNPYKDYDWLEPVDYGVLANIRGKRDGTLEWVIVQTQYSSGNVKVNYGLTIHTSAEEHEQKMHALADVEYEKISENPDIYVLAPRLTDPNRSYIREINMVKDHIFYNISAVTNMGHTEQADEIFDKLLAEILETS